MVRAAVALLGVIIPGGGCRMHFDRPSVRALTGNYGNPWTDVGVSVDPDSMLRVGGESGCFQQAGTWMCWGDGHNGAVGVEDPADQIGPRPLCE